MHSWVLLRQSWRLLGSGRHLGRLLTRIPVWQGKQRAQVSQQSFSLSLSLSLSLSPSLSLLRAMGSGVCPTPSPARERAAAVLGGNEFPGGGFAPQARFYTAKEKESPDRWPYKTSAKQCSAVN